MFTCAMERYPLRFSRSELCLVVLILLTSEEHATPLATEPDSTRHDFRPPSASHHQPCHHMIHPTHVHLTPKPGYPPFHHTSITRHGNSKHPRSGPYTHPDRAHSAPYRASRVLHRKPYTCLHGMVDKFLLHRSRPSRLLSIALPQQCSSQSNRGLETRDLGNEASATGS